MIKSDQLNLIIKCDLIEERVIERLTHANQNEAHIDVANARNIGNVVLCNQGAVGRQPDINPHLFGVERYLEYIGAHEWLTTRQD